VLQAFLELLNQLSRHEHVRLVVATRVRTPRQLPAGSVVVLRQLEDHEGMKLLQSRVEAESPLAAGEDMVAAQQLVQLVHCNPLTLAVAAGLVNKGRTWQVSSTSAAPVHA
jgi:hypothetical protein